MSTTPEKIALHNAREGRLAIYLVYRAPADKLTKVENTITIFKLTSGRCFMQINLAFALFFPFHELHMRSMQIYEKLILHVQVEIDFSVSC